jgi:hypothetical protein
MTGTATLLLACLAAASPLADPEPSVQAGREALDRWVWEYPWYDSQTDGVRRARVSEPWYVRWEWLWDAVRDFFQWLGNLFSFRRGAAGSSSWSWVRWVTLTVLALLLTLLVYLIIRLWRARAQGMSGAAAKAEASDKAEEKRRVEALPSGVGRKRGDLLDAARACYQEGRYREAIIYLFSYQLVRLDKNQLIRLAKGKTNRQYLRELGRDWTLRRLLEQTMVAFEEVFFGNYAIDRARFESVWSRLDQFESLVAVSSRQ